MDVYEAIYRRRDVRSFDARPIPQDLLNRILDAAHHAGSVGFMQPWDFIVIRSPTTKRQVHDLYRAANDAAGMVYEGERGELYRSLKLAGILDAPVNLAITVDPTRGGPHVLGRHTMPETDVYSACLAIQNLWLAARAEGLGVGWVSIIDPEAVKGVLGIPPDKVLVAYLCIGYPAGGFQDEPLLATVGWRDRLPLAAVVHDETWKGSGEKGHLAALD